MYRHLTLTSRSKWLIECAAVLLALQALPTAGAQEPAPKKPAEADKLHVVLLVAGADQNIGNADLQDIQAMRRVIDLAFPQQAKRVVYHDLTGKNPATRKHFTGPEIIKHLKAMKIEANHNVLIFHSGHGGMSNRKRPEESHILTVDGGSVARKDLTKAVQDQKPRGLIILTDCCSAFSESAVGLVEELDEPRPNVKTVRNLLVKATGFISITAAEDGKVAQANFRGDNPAQAGSAFTVALTRLWYRQDVTFTTWRQFFSKLRPETNMASGGQHRARAFHLGDETPAALPAAGKLGP
jgi:hypothetical protein